jgi:hypothetical protein
MYNIGMSMKHIKMHLQRTQDERRKTERGELMRFFCRKLNLGRAQDGIPAISMPRMGKILEKIPTKDLYYIQTVCNDAPNFAKKFWFVLNPEKYEKKNKDVFAKDAYGSRTKSKSRQRDGSLE